MDGYWPIFFLLVVLKVPAIFMIYLLYWAAKNEPENGTVDEGDDGGNQRRRPKPLMPRGPRRGPHGGGAAAPSSRRSRSSEPATGHRVAAKGDQARAREADPARARDSDRSV
jgi:hypothetical protein